MTYLIVRARIKKRAGVMFGLLLLGVTLTRAEDSALHLTLPTDNTALLTGNNSEFYQVIERNLHGVISYPWQGGQYGFVRDPVEMAARTVFTRFHEGMDIRPVQRDIHGEPLDQVRAIGDGIVAYANEVAGASNYGRYVVVEHRWGGCPYYSLYAHLSTIDVHSGQRVRRGEKLAVMGHTGEGINRSRAHVHVELNLLLSDQFAKWHDTFFKNDPNRHGIYNGINLAGLDLARLYLALRDDASLTIPAFIGREETFYKVIIPASPNFQLPRRYPWLAGVVPNEKPAAWEVSFAASGLPLHIRASERASGGPELSYVKQSEVDYRYLTRGIVAGRGEKAHLSESGQTLMRLLTFPD